MSGGSPPTNTLREYRSTRSPLRWGKQWVGPRPASPWSPDSSSPKGRSSSMGNRDEWPVSTKGLRFTSADILNEHRTENKLRRRDSEGGNETQTTRSIGMIVWFSWHSLKAPDIVGDGEIFMLLLEKKERLSVLRQKIKLKITSNKQLDRRQKARPGHDRCRIITDWDTFIVMTKRHIVYLVFCHNFWLHVKHKTLLKSLESTGKKHGHGLQFYGH